MSSNLQYKGIKEVLDKMGTISARDSGPSAGEVNNDWKRLASFMSGQK